MSKITRRSFVATAATTPMLMSTQTQAQSKRYQKGASPWPLSMNTSTIRPASLADKIRVTADAGWDAIEPWVNDLEDYEKAGGNLGDLGKEIADKGLFVANVIGLWNSLPPTQEEWEVSLPATRNRMRMASAIGSRFIAAIPGPDRADFDLAWGAARYADLIKIARDDYGITAAIEFIGFLEGVHRFGQAAAIAIDANDPDACIIADTFHLWRGGSGFNGIRQLSGNAIANFHWNDIAEGTPQEGTGDAARIYPGDGILPLVQALKDLKSIGYTRALSLELFNRDHWKQDPLVVSKTGLEKMLQGITEAGV